LSFVLIRVWPGAPAESATPDTAGLPRAPTAPGAQGGGTVGESAAPIDPLLDASVGPSSINADYQLEDVLAVVNGEPIAMRDLDRSVRVARVLGDVTGDPAPANGAPELRDFQIQMLKRLVDVELMIQLAERESLMVPGGETDVAIETFLSEAGKTDAELRAAMATHGVTDAELDRWFRDARTANLVVAQSIMAGRETEDRDAVTQAWLQEQWNTQSIQIDFYEPES
jgi:hypothetical protein